MRIRRLVFLIGAFLAAGCSILTSPGSVDGAWRQDKTFPGSSLVFTLTTNGDAVAGTGTWSGEACCDGTVTIAGDATEGAVSLTFVFVANGASLPPRSSQFTGRVLDGNTMTGTLASAGSSVDVVFKRTN